MSFPKQNIRIRLVRDATDMDGEYYDCDTFDEIDEAHKPLVRVLDAADLDAAGLLRIKDFGDKFTYGDRAIYYLYINKSDV